MRNELKNIETIERYLLNKMTAEEKNAFEKVLAQNPKLKEEVQLQESLMKGMKNISLKQQAKKAYQKHYFGKGIKKWGGIGGSIIVISAATYFAWNYFSAAKVPTTRNVTYELPELNENGEKVWADADKYLPYQLFDIDNSKDTVIETQDGIVMAVPAGCFLDANGQPVNGAVQLEVKEAIQSDDILMSGLSTKSGNTPLETGGMFYLNARKDGVSLKIDANKGIYTEIPTDEVKPGMQVYEGKRMPNGTIDWIKPAPLEKFLVPVDIHSLNFYPPEYEDSLAAMVTQSLSKGDKQNKRYKDSLYYSFARLFSENTNSNKDTCGASDTLKINSSNSEITLSKNNSSFYLPSEPNKMVYSKSYQNISRPKKKQIFDELKKKYPDYLYNIIGIESVPLNESENISISIAIFAKEIKGINPAKVKAIWTSKFNNTILATREFEERMEYIHRSCNNAVLDVYVNNLDKKLCTLDSMAYNAGGGMKFQEFAARGDGRVKTENPSHIRKLQKYYTDKAKAYTEAAAKTEKEFWAEDQKARNKATEDRVDHALKDGQRQAVNFSKEYEINLKEACRQLGYDKMSPVPAGTYNATITSSGWKNIDKAVRESTFARTTLDYTDPYSGKKAVIKYEEVSVSIAQRENYDALFVYAIPDQLNSFMRLNQTGNLFTEKLNELMKYEMVYVGYKGEQTFMYYQESVESRRYEGIALTAVSKKELQEKLKEINTFGHRQEILDELSVRHREQKENVRVKNVQNLMEFRERIQKVIFPCEGTIDTTAKAMTDTTKISMMPLAPSK